MRVKTSELTGRVLDYVVAHYEGVPVYVKHGVALECVDSDLHDPIFYSPRTDYEQGCPIVDRETICTRYLPDQQPDQHWEAGLPRTNAQSGVFWMARGPTRLVAALRCHLMARLGFEVDIPENVWEKLNT